MQIITTWLGLCLVTAMASAQTQPLLREDTVPVSPHVWAILGFPNIGFVVGTKATLVVDTGLGPRNGATVAKVARRLAPNNQLYLTTTHFHPEHAAGVGGFPPGTILIRDRVQQEEMDQHGAEMVQLFASRNDQQRELLANVQLHPPDECGFRAM
jgi:glyoxylase-like metal-dependent hydrolase (beta-lactamase superfamily II)